MDAEIRASLPGRVCGKRFHPRALRIIRETIIEYRHSSRHEIARAVCDRLGWVDHRGRRKEMGAAVVLLRFHRKGWIELPAARRHHRPSLSRQRLPEGFAIPEQTLESPLNTLGGIRLEPVTSRGDSRLWNGLIATFHYLGYRPFCGAQLRYLVRSEQGVLGALGFSAAALTVRERDLWIGWNREQRRTNRHWVVNNSRFLIVPWVRVPHLASHLLGLAARRLPVDFQARYGYRPLLLETFVEEGRFAGTCYRAANWVRVGRTSGRGRNDPRSWRQLREQKPPLPIKSIWLYPLAADWRTVLCNREGEVLRKAKVCEGEAA
ncbi:MAG: DUF4338 domain-containing protein [Methylococcaceae bacterium]|nr:DUF4338 domain-containing protein [Methylococcaceae bacterium]